VPPVNDTCATATTIAALPFALTAYDISDATNDAIALPLCGASNPAWLERSIWFTWTAPNNDTIKITHSDSRFYGGMLGIFTGACGSLTLVECADLYGDAHFFTPVSGTTYTFMVAIWSGAASPVTCDFSVAVAVAPAQVTGLTATPSTSGTGIHSIALAWGAASGANRYEVQVCTGAGCGGFVQQAQPTATSYTHGSRPGATLHRYRVRAMDGSFVGPWSDIVEATTGAVTPPGPVTFTAVNPNGQTPNIALNWTHSGQGVTSQVIERCTGEGCTTFTAYASPGLAVRTWALSGLTNNTHYRFRLKTSGPDGVVYSRFANIRYGATGTIPTGAALIVPEHTIPNGVPMHYVNHEWNANDNGVVPPDADVVLLVAQTLCAGHFTANHSGSWPRGISRYGRPTGFIELDPTERSNISAGQGNGWPTNSISCQSFGGSVYEFWDAPPNPGVSTRVLSRADLFAWKFGIFYQEGNPTALPPFNTDRHYGELRINSLTMINARWFFPITYEEVEEPEEPPPPTPPREVVVQNAPPCCECCEDEVPASAGTGGTMPADPFLPPAPWQAFCVGGGVPPTAPNPVNSEDWGT
jgi:hypothetical protein